MGVDTRARVADARLMMVSAFVIPQRRDQRLRQALVIVSARLGVFFTVLALWPRVALGYVLAYLLMLHVLRFMDMIQHDYGGNP